MNFYANYPVAVYLNNKSIPRSMKLEGMTSKTLEFKIQCKASATNICYDSRVQYKRQSNNESYEDTKPLCKRAECRMSCSEHNPCFIQTKQISP